ncbi:MAG: hypothetical protein HYT67_02565 [Candidatus Yanofskybacteria bacterium]|nr:hypothetical protein [Candidatus Yanofskybacteria bacterium]
MKQLKIVAAVVSFLAIIVWAASSSAQERVTVDVNYVGGELMRSVRFPSAPGPNLRHGHKYVVNGIDIEAVASITEIVAVEGRYQRKVLGNARYFTDLDISGFRGRHEEPDFGADSQKTDYIEVAGSMRLPKTHGHSLLVGVARATTEQRWRWEDPFGGIYRHRNRSDYLGLVYGVEGTQGLGSLTFDYSARRYYHLMRKVNDAPNRLPASGFELGGSATWAIAEHFGVRGGYSFRRLHTEVGTTPFESQENNDDHGPVVGIRLSF